MVTLAAMGQVLVFRMVEDQILYAQAGRRLTGVFDGRMVFFIGMEDIRFGVEAESFVKEPFTVADIDFFPGLVRFIATARQSAIGKCQGKAEQIRLPPPHIE